MPSIQSPARSREEINDAIRSFLADRRGRGLTGAERRVYERLRTEWFAAPRRAVAPSYCPGGAASRASHAR
ncbi:hypothetical protein ACFQ2B_22595 [Streptomyces stramineus]|uniref:Uncharacterized protein n=1 Tax=Streptomyces stramineus TaxID=173861 RepID=A0ABN0ZUK2_9ACTN